MGLFLSLPILILPILVGCTSTKDMALNPDIKSLDTQKKSIAIFTLTVRNDFKPDYGLAPCNILVKPSAGSGTWFTLAGDWQGNGAHPGWYNWKGTIDFPVSLGLDPGKYVISNVVAGGSAVILNWHSSFPLNAEFDLPPRSVVYLGHMVMANRERKDDEPRSGPVIGPDLVLGLIPAFVEQGVSGMSGGTMDISITDQSSEDIPKFLAKCPCLQAMAIKTAIATKQ
jgi:hypothetical protein